MALFGISFFLFFFFFFFFYMYFRRNFRFPPKKKNSLATPSERKDAKSMRELCVSAGHQTVSKMAAILIFLFSTIYYATADISVSSDNYPTQEDSCRCNLAVVRFS